MPGVLVNIVRFQPSRGQRESDVVVLEPTPICLAQQLFLVAAGKPCGAEMVRFRVCLGIVGNA
jgi:hypothetical protein